MALNTHQSHTKHDVPDFFSNVRSNHTSFTGPKSEKIPFAVYDFLMPVILKQDQGHKI